MATLIDKIVSSHYIPLQPPYPVIYCNNEVGIQIATLIVVTEPKMVAPMGNRSVYRMVSHSHPVVVYGNKHSKNVTGVSYPNDYCEGIVWDRVELTGVQVIAFVNNGDESPMLSDDVIYDRLNQVLMKGRINAMFYNSPFSLTNIINKLESCGVHIPKLPLISGRARLVLGGANRPDKYSVTANNIANAETLPAFYFAAIFENTETTEVELCRQIDEYIEAYSASKETPVNIEFWTTNTQLITLADRLTKKYTSTK